MSGFWQLVKFAWAQYLLVLIFWYGVLYKGFFGFLIQNKVFQCVEVMDINTKNLQSLE